MSAFDDFMIGQVVSRSDDLRAMRTQRNELRGLLERYMSAYPAFRIKPAGAPGSQVRDEQERLMALEDEARAAIAKVSP